MRQWRKMPLELYHDFFGTVSWVVMTQSEHSIKIIKAINYISVKHPAPKWVSPDTPAM